MRTSETRAQLDESSENGQQGQFTFSSPCVARDGFYKGHAAFIDQRPAGHGRDLWTIQRGEELLLVMARAALLVVSSQRAFDHRIGYGRRLDFVYFDDFTFELFVILKKSAHHG